MPFYFAVPRNPERWIARQASESGFRRLQAETFVPCWCPGISRGLRPRSTPSSELARASAGRTGRPRTPSRRCWNHWRCSESVMCVNSGADGAAIFAATFVISRRLAFTLADEQVAGTEGRIKIGIVVKLVMIDRRRSAGAGRCHSPGLGQAGLPGGHAYGRPGSVAVLQLLLLMLLLTLPAETGWARRWFFASSTD